MIRLKTLLHWIAVLGIAPTLCVPGVAWADGQDFDNLVQNVRACGKWVVRLEDFGKEKMRDYFDYVPRSLQSNFTLLTKPSTVYRFDPSNNTFRMSFVYPDPEGNVVLRIAFGRYKQKGKKLKLRFNGSNQAQAGITVMEAAFADIAANTILAERDVVALIPYADIRAKKVRFKGRVRRANKTDSGGNSRAQLRMKMKARVKYDIQFENNSEFADKFDEDGVLKLRMRTKDC